MAAAEPFTDPDAALSFIRAGNAIVTVRSQRTGVRYTYKITQAEQASNDTRGPAYFVALLKGRDNTSDYTYLGMVRGDRFFTTKATRHMEAAAFCKGFRHAYEYLARRHTLPPGAELWHESRCGRCGRKLTVPESIQSGIGPECIKMTGSIFA